MPPNQIAAGSAPVYRTDEETPPAETRSLIARLAGSISRARRIESEHALALPIWVHVVALAVVGFVTLYIARGLWGWTYDDVFIIHRYARNFANGLGMVY